MKVRVAENPGHLEISKSALVYGLCIISQLARASAWIKTESVPDLFMTLLQLFCVGYYGLLKIKKKSISYLDLAVLAFYFSFFVSTLLVSRDYVSWFTYAMQGIGAIFVVEELLEDDEILGVILIRNVTFGFLVINLMTVFLFPDGIGSTYYYFLGSRIGLTPFVLLAVGSAVMADYITEEKMFSGFSGVILAVALLNLILLEVSTGMIALAILGVFLIAGFFLGEAVDFLANYWLLTGIWVLIFLVVVFTQHEILQTVLTWFHEDTTFGGRTVIWQTACDYIEKRPVFGYGVTPTGAFYISAYINDRMLPAHNEILNILYQGGVFALTGFAAMLFFVGRMISQCRDTYLSALGSVFLFSVFCVMITEIQTQKGIFFIILAMVYQICINHGKKLPSKIEKENRNEKIIVVGK